MPDAAGKYHAYADITALAGVENIRIASQLDNNDSSVDQARVAAAIAWSEALVESRLQMHYVLPLSPAQTYDQVLLKDTCARLSIWWLSQNRGISDESGDLALKMDNMRTTAINQLLAWAAAFTSTFSAPRKFVTAPTAPVGVSDTSTASNL